MDTSGSLIGVDLGGTKVHVARIEGNQIASSEIRKINARGSKQEVLDELIQAIRIVCNDEVEGIGIGIPSVMNIEQGIVYDVVNIPSWDEVHLKKILEKEFHVPTYINNDANCFAIGEKYFGKGKAYKDMIGLIVGTGMAGGIIVDNKLYNGPNCGSGEFGMMPYKKHYYEYYCSGQFFTRKYNMNGEELAELAGKGDKKAIKAFVRFGNHLGNAIKAILYALDPAAIILGGSVSKSYSFFKGAMNDSLKDFVYKNSLEKLTIEVSEDNNIPVLGAAALYYDNITLSKTT